MATTHDVSTYATAMKSVALSQEPLQCSWPACYRLEAPLGHCSRDDDSAFLEPREPLLHSRRLGVHGAHLDRRLAVNRDDDRSPLADHLDQRGQPRLGLIQRVGISHNPNYVNLVRLVKALG